MPSLKHLVNPQKWNKYAYTLNNPLRYFDPDGLEEIEVQLRSFIQQRSVGDPLGRRFAGDNRGFTSAQNVTSRTSITVRIETDASKRPGNPIISITQPGTAGQEMAEGFLRNLAGDRFEVFSAGTKPVHLNPNAVRAMSEVGIDIAGHRSKSVKEFEGQYFDYVITVCDNAKETCPIFPGTGQLNHHSFDDQRWNSEH